MKSNILIILLGGSEKTIVAKQLVEKYQYQIIPMDTTREPRQNEITTDFIFVSDEVFDKNIEKGLYLDVISGNNRYGYDKTILQNSLVDSNCIVYASTFGDAFYDYHNTIKVFVLDSIPTERLHSQLLLSKDVSINLVINDPFSGADKTIDYIHNNISCKNPSFFIKDPLSFGKVICYEILKEIYYEKSFYYITRELNNKPNNSNKYWLEVFEVQRIGRFEKYKYAPHLIAKHICDSYRKSILY